MIAANELDNTATVYEIKRNRKNISMKALEEKAERMLAAVHTLNGYDVKTAGLDMEDM